jgi:hypothetical protein
MPTKKTTKPEEVAEVTAAAEISEIYETAAEPEVPVVASPWENKVTLTIAPPMSKAEEKDAIVYVNGRNWIMPKGGTYEVPKPVADEYYRSLRARTHGMKRKTDMVQKEQKINAHADAVINGKA